MISHKNWLFVSLYYQRNKWGLMFDEAIMVFIRKVKYENLIISYILHLNNFRGNYIGISFHTTNSKLLTLAATIDHFFKNYFIEHPSKDEPTNLTPTGIFKNFHNNSIQYNLHLFPFTPKQLSSKKVEVELCKRLSPIMIEALGKEEIDLTILVTYSSYLHLLLLKVISASLSEAASITENSIKAYRASIGKSNEKSTVSTGHYVIIEIIKEILVVKSEASLEMNWTKKVIKAFNAVIARLYQVNSESEISMISIFTRFSRTINRQLGISDTAGVSLINHIYKGIKLVLNEESTEKTNV